MVNAIVMFLGLILSTIFLALRLPGGNYDTVAQYYNSAGNEHMLSIYGTPEIFFTFALGTVISAAACWKTSRRHNAAADRCEATPSVASVAASS